MSTEKWEYMAELAWANIETKGINEFMQDVAQLEEATQVHA